MIIQRHLMVAPWDFLIQIKMNFHIKNDAISIMNNNQRLLSWQALIFFMPFWTKRVHFPQLSKLCNGAMPLKSIFNWRNEQKMEVEKNVGSWMRKFSSFLQRIRCASALCNIQSQFNEGWWGGYATRRKRQWPPMMFGKSWTKLMNGHIESWYIIFKHVS